MSSRKVALTATFLALAAGGVAACDSSSDGDADFLDTTTYSSDTSTYESGVSDTGSGMWDGDEGAVPETDEVFYCADEGGEIVDEDNCQDDDTSSYFLWHSPAYARNLAPGTILDSGEHFPAGDRETRRAFRLPATGKVANGTVKTNVVGAGSGSGYSDGSGSSGG